MSVIESLWRLQWNSVIYFIHLKILNHWAIRRLDINIYEQPTGMHFDPHQVDFPVGDPGSGIINLSLFHPTGQERYNICVGRIAMINRAGKRMEAFSFGGALETETRQDHSFCCVTSSVPILDLAGLPDNETALINEIEKLLARQRADWQGDDLGYEQRLAGISPQELFTALVSELREQLQEIPSMNRGQSFWELQSTLRKVVKFVEPDGELPAGSPTLKVLLGP